MCLMKYKVGGVLVMVPASSLHADVILLDKALPVIQVDCAVCCR